MGRFIIQTPNVVGDNFGAVGSNNRLNGQTVQVMLELDLNEHSYLFIYFFGWEFSSSSSSNNFGRVPGHCQSINEAYERMEIERVH